MSNGYNIASDCVDKHRADLLALVCVDWDSAAKKIELHHFSFGDLQTLTNRFARGLAALELARGDRILLQLPNGFEFPVAFIGAIKASPTTLPIAITTEISSLPADATM